MTGLTGVQSMFDGPSQLVPGVLRGYRTWSGVTPEGELMSTGMSHAWRASPFGGNPEVAHCLRAIGMPEHDGGAPGRDCPCGLYGWYTPDDTRIVPASIAGVVQASGRVILGEHGFRAERLEVLGLTVTAKHMPVNVEHGQWLLSKLDGFGYPVYPDKAALVAAFPPDDLSGLVDHRCDGRCEERSRFARGSLLWNNGPSAGSAGSSGFHAAVQQVVSAAVASADVITKSFHMLQAAVDVNAEDPPKTDPAVDPRAHALSARQSRNTGPPVVPMFRAAVRAARRGRR